MVKELDEPVSTFDVKRVCVSQTCKQTRQQLNRYFEVVYNEDEFDAECILPSISFSRVLYV